MNGEVTVMDQRGEAHNATSMLCKLTKVRQLPCEKTVRTQFVGG